LNTNLCFVSWIPMLIVALLFNICFGNLFLQETYKGHPEILFESGTEGYACYRIPAILTTTNGILLAFAEGRKGGCSDTGDIDLVMKRSEDQGRTWSELMVIRDDGENVCGNPAPVVDRTTGVVYLLSTWNLGEDHESAIIEGTSRDTRRVFVMLSENEGRTWTEPQEITGSVKEDHWTWYATGPCHGIQLKNGTHAGRLLIPCDHIEAGSEKYFSHVIFSDDHGASWELGGTTPEDQVNECTVAELADGRLMLNMRNYDRSQKSRKVSYSQDGGERWSHLVSDTTLIEPICQASLLSVTAGDEGKHFLLFLNPADKHERQMMTLRISENGGVDWTGSILLHESPSAYSDLTQLPGGDIACLYEAGMDNPYQGIVYREVSWSQILVHTKQNKPIN